MPDKKITVSLDENIYNKVKYVSFITNNKIKNIIQKAINDYIKEVYASNVLDLLNTNTNTEPANQQTSKPAFFQEIPTNSVKKEEARANKDERIKKIIDYHFQECKKYNVKGIYGVQAGKMLKSVLKDFSEDYLREMIFNRMSDMRTENNCLKYLTRQIDLSVMLSRYSLDKYQAWYSRNKIQIKKTEMKKPAAEKTEYTPEEKAAFRERGMRHLEEIRRASEI